MATSRSNRFLYQWLRQLRQQRQAGFTLLEILVSLIVSGIVVSGLLYLVVELVQTDRREATLDQVQQDMGRALDYIKDDLREAVYVYTNPDQIANQLGADPQFPDSGNDTPVLAFWRIDPLEQGLPACNSAAANFDACQVLRLRQAVYTLVVYVQRTNDGNANWPGLSRIIRYELTKYPAGTLTQANLATLRGGYRDPTDPVDVNAPFEVWQVNGTPAGSSAVLVDFVDRPTATFNRTPLSDGGGACSSFGDYRVVPSTATTTSSTSFFACVLNPDPDNNPVTADRSNQDLFVFLRGNALDGPPGVVNSFSEASALPTLQSQVLIRGVIDKNLLE
jgi:prepilin-type N-terminal cleavage/methylation domain-containing protein